jgi:hypothetical protein
VGVPFFVFWLLEIRADHVDEFFISITAEFPQHCSAKAFGLDVVDLDLDGLWVVIADPELACWVVEVGNLSSASARVMVGRCCS